MTITIPCGKHPDTGAPLSVELPVPSDREYHDLLERAYVRARKNWAAGAHTEEHERLFLAIANGLAPWKAQAVAKVLGERLGRMYRYDPELSAYDGYLLACARLLTHLRYTDPVLVQAYHNLSRFV